MVGTDCIAAATAASVGLVAPEGAGVEWKAVTPHDMEYVR
jgi:hypothetical protein